MFYYKTTRRTVQLSPVTGSFSAACSAEAPQINSVMLINACTGETDDLLIVVSELTNNIDFESIVSEFGKQKSRKGPIA